MSGDSANDPTEIVITGRKKAAAPPVQSPSVAVPQCYIDIYPFEGGMYQIQNGPNVSISVSKNINEPFGTFSILLPPGGPLGMNTPPTWDQVITPMSFVVIGMRRGQRSQVVMLGLACTIAETEVWRQGQGTRRMISIQGRDFGHYFNMATYYSTWFLGATGAALPTDGTAAIAATAASPILGANFISGTPDQIAQAWYNAPMAGTTGVLSKSFVPYKKSQVKFPDAMSTWFESFTAIGTNTFTEYLITTEGTWNDKFRAILPYPWYDFFVITAPPGFYPAASGGYAFTSQGLGPSAVATPTLVARLNPLPNLKVTTTGTNPQFNGLDATAWNALPKFTMDGVSQVESTVGFDESLVLNFFTLNPTYAGPLFGVVNTNTTPFIFSYAAAGDTASIQRYGFRPANGTFNWMANQSATGTDPNTFYPLINRLLARFCAVYEPMALMARGQCTTFLRPDIMPGCVFNFRPYKNDETWDFYIEGVTHTFEFGGDSRTSLTLARGLPSSVYAAQGDTGLLYNVHTGNAERLNGKYQASLPPGSAAPLQAIPVGQFQPFFAGISKPYSTPQGTNAAP